MKIHILFDVRTGAYGGGNQFLRCLKAWLKPQSCYTHTPEEADVFLFNSHQNALDVARIKRRYPEKPFIHRVDGPMRLYNRRDDLRDNVVNTANRLIADGTIFQSVWSREKNLELGLPPTHFEKVIYNASDPKIFNAHGRGNFNPEKKIRLIAVSWSSNEKKGFGVYQWLDENLDFDRYEMHFLGNSPMKFKNIRSIPPVDSRGVAQKLRESDIYITGSQSDPCSNSLIEALNCGLPVIALNDGGHPELLGASGELYDDARDIPELLDKIVENPRYFLNGPSLPSMEEVGSQYCDFARQLTDAVRSGNYRPKTFSFWDCIRLGRAVLACKWNPCA